MINQLKHLIIKLSGLSIGLVLLCTACDRQNLTNKDTANVVSEPVVTTAGSPQIEQSVSDQKNSNPSQNDGEIYQEALTKAEAAHAIAQSATSKDDWLLVANNLQTSIEMLKSISEGSVQYIQAVKVLPKYEQQFTIAKQKSVNFVAKSSPKIFKVVHQQPATPPPQNADLFSLPIKKKLGGIPVVAVTFNNDRQFLMLLDTGASRTLITKSMSEQMQLKSVGTAKAKTANGMGSFSLAKIDRVKFGEGIVNNLLVAIGDNTLNYGLLGHDVYDGYDMTIKEHAIEFRKR
jgi:predicted aspartyl protease